MPKIQVNSLEAQTKTSKIIDKQDQKLDKIIQGEFKAEEDDDDDEPFDFGKFDSD